METDYALNYVCAFRLAFPWTTWLQDSSVLESAAGFKYITETPFQALPMQTQKMVFFAGQIHRVARSRSLGVGAVPALPQPVDQRHRFTFSFQFEVLTSSLYIS